MSSNAPAFPRQTVQGLTRDGSERNAEVQGLMRTNLDFAVARETFEGLHNGSAQTRNQEVATAAQVQKQKTPSERVTGIDFFFKQFAYCCGLTEYWGINMTDVTHYKPEVTVQDIIKGYYGVKQSAAVMIIEVNYKAPTRLNALKKHIDEIAAGDLHIVDIGLNPNTSSHLWVGLFQVNQQVFKLLATIHPWGYLHQYWKGYSATQLASNVATAQREYDGILKAQKAKVGQ